MSSVNKCIILGFLGREPEIKSFQSGDRVAQFSIATSESWKDKTTGEWKDKTEWHNIVVRNDGLVKYIENNIHKGSKVYIEGQLQYRKYQDQNGNDRFVTEIVIGRFNGQLTLLSGKEEKTDTGHDYPAVKGNLNNDLEDSIPF